MSRLTGLRSPAGVLADPRVRLGLGTAAMLGTALAVHRNRVGPGEARAFRAVNGLPDSLYPPAWAVMQLGALGAAPATACLAWLAGDGDLAGRLLVAGTGSWALSKLVKQIVRRPRPEALLPGIRIRGRDAAGLGYLSGHAGVAVALGAAAPQHGYAIMTDVGQISGGRVRLRPGTLYAALNRLVVEDLVEVDREEIVDARLRRYYRLTDHGTAQIASMMAISKGTVKSNAARGLAALARKLEEES